MADLEYTVGVNTRRAQASLNRLEKKTESTSEAFGRLKGALAGLAVGAFIQQSFQAAGAIDNISRATGIAIQTLVGFSNAFQAVDGTIDQARDAVSDFSQNLGDARLGAAELQTAFQQAGVSLDDLRTLSAEATFQKTINGLSQMEDRSQAAFVAMRIFGESFKGIPIEDLNSRLGESIKTSGSAAQAYREAGAASRNLSNAIAILRQELVIALEPLSNFVNSLADTEEGTRKIIRAIVQFGTSLAGLLIVSKVTKAVFGLVTGFLTLGRGISKTLARFGRLIATYKTFVSFAKSAADATKLQAARSGLLAARFGAVRAVGALLLPLFGKIAAALFLISEAIRAVTGAGLLTWLGRASDKIEGLFSQSTRAGQAIAALANAFSDLEEPRLPSTNPGRPGGESGQRPLEREREQVENKVIDALAAQKSAIDRIVAANRERNETTLENLRIQRDQVDMTDRQIGIQNNLLDFTRQYEQQLQGLKDRRQELMAEEEKNAAVIERIDAAIKQVTQDYIAQYPEVLRVSREIQDALAAEEARADALERQNEAQRRVADAASRTNDFLVRMGEQTEDMRREMLQLDMSPLERQIQDIEQSINRDARNAIGDLYDDLQNAPTPAAQQEIERQIQRIEQESQQAIQAQTRIAEESYRIQRSFSQGWEDAFREYAENATDSAQTAQRVFEKTTKGMEDAIVGFAKTGKFEFKSFVSSILEELLRSQVRQIIAKTFGIFGGGGSGTGGGGGSLFGGFFATGGLIPPGRFGVVGENGPELVQGPANVTPDAGTANVTYNINAVDADSFKQMVARDPEFMFAVTEKGRKSIPQTRR